MTVKWKIEKRKYKDLQVYYKNPRRISKREAEHLHKSIATFGLVDKPVVNLNGTIIGGHQRLYVMAPLPEDEIEVMMPNRLLTNQEVEELNIRLNKNRGEFDDDILANQYELEDLISYGFTEEELSVKGFSSQEEEEECCPTCGKKLRKK